jgi:hypothetical protein
MRRVSTKGLASGSHQLRQTRSFETFEARNPKPNIVCRRVQGLGHDAQ